MTQLAIPLPSAPPITRPTALITGASIGIGRDLATLFAADGYDVVLVARNQAQLESVAADLRSKYGIRAEVLRKDLSCPAAPQEIFDYLQAKGLVIDVLANNAGFGTNGPFAELDPASQVAMLQVNIVALTHLTRLLLGGMVERRRGRVLNLASVAAFQPGPYMAVYYATKAYVLHFSEAIARELVGTGVSVTTLCPGPTRTEFFERAQMGTPPMIRANMMDSMAVARIGYKAMLKGKRLAVTGFQNRLFSVLVRFAPRRMVTAIAGKINRAR